MLVPILFVWGRVGLGLLQGLWTELRRRDPAAGGAEAALLAEIARLSPEAARAEAEAAIAAGAFDLDPAGALPAWAGGLHPQIAAVFRRYSRIAVPGVGALGGSAAGADAFLPGHRVLGPANTAGDRWWVVAPGSPELVLSEESALDARALARLPGPDHVLCWMSRMKTTTQGGIR